MKKFYEMVGRNQGTNRLEFGGNFGEEFYHCYRPIGNIKASDHGFGNCPKIRRLADLMLNKIKAVMAEVDFAKQRTISAQRTIQELKHQITVRWHTFSMYPGTVLCWGLEGAPTQFFSRPEFCHRYRLLSFNSIRRQWWPWIDIIVRTCFVIQIDRCLLLMSISGYLLYQLLFLMFWLVFVLR